ncbi:chromosome segregation protein SMC [Paenibacillus sp. PK3_47]|uniref:AAA family ATPase n=1 Tax=Paenibacillus sp. PK3_47 TaxID=2072642 RepID=UPI00201D51BC|nr:AAA family ATPase [Paenibacillus sp. PK3_47]UQZ36096.1 chromosome segregation protein SMC [Paenibacillus sp. PK3_47]
MIIQQLQIGGFGRLHNRELELKEGVTVLYGRNEAGKSTTMQFIRAMLYGIPGRVHPAERYEPVQGGIHGGMLTALDEEGASWRIRRYAAGTEAQGRSEKLNITVSYPGGTVEELGQADLERRLLGGISRSMFRQLFAVSLDELQELGALQSQEMSSYLFHAGMGGGGEIMRAERKLIQETEKLYKPRGKVQEAARILQAIEKLEGQMAESRSYLPRYNENSAALESAEDNLAELEERRKSGGEMLAKLRKAQEIRELWLKRREAELELAGLPVIEAFPENGAERWQLLEGEIRVGEAGIFRLQRQEGEITAGLVESAPDGVLAAQGPLLERLDRRRSSYEDRRAERQRLVSELGALREHLDRILRGIGAGWSKAELAAFSGAAADREAARRYAAAFAGYDRRMEAREAERQSLRSRTAAAAAALQAAERALAGEHASGAAGFAGLAPRRPREVLQLWDELQQAAERWREAQLGGAGPHRSRRSGGAGERRSARDRRLPLAGAALALALPALLWLTGAPPVSAWTALGLLAAADLALWAGLLAERRPGSSPPGHGGDAGAAAAEMLRLQGLLLSGAEPERAFSRQAKMDAGSLEAGMKELRRLMEAWTAWRQRVDKLEGEREACRTEAETLTGQEQALAAEMEQAEAEFMELDESYGTWLRERRLPEGISPEGLPDIFAMAEQGNELLRQMNKLSSRLKDVEEECIGYENEVLELMKKAGHFASGNPAEDAGYTANSGADPSVALLSWLEIRKRDWELLKGEQLRRENMAERLLGVQEELAEKRRELEELKQRREKLLQEGGAEDGEDFLRRASAVQLRTELARSVRQWELAMFGGWEGERAEGLQQLLEHHDAAALAEKRAAAEDAVLQIEEERNALLQHRGKLLQEREYLKERCQEDHALQQLEEQRSALRNLAGQYAVTAIAAELMGRTRRIYEQEKQPQVLQLASAYFAKLTEGEYRRIIMTMGHKELKAEHKDAGLLDSGLLSRGTAEQLYLAIRLALAGTMTRQARLPLLFDDLFVNFDERRLHAALSLIGELSAARQIVMMTCHRHIAEASARLIPGAAVIPV